MRESVQLKVLSLIHHTVPTYEAILFHLGCPVRYYLGFSNAPKTFQDVLVIVVRTNSMKHQPGVFSARHIKGQERLELMKYIMSLYIFY